VTQTMEAGRSGRTSPQLPHFLMTTVGRLLVVIACVVIIGAAAMGSYVVSRVMGDNELKAANLRVLQVQGDNQKLTADNTNLMATIADFKIQIKDVQTKLAMIMPTENTFNINPNQSLVVGGGRLTIGLIGSPTNESVNININGKPQSAAVGALITSVLDASTTCQVGVQSFDMFRAVLTATCSEVKPR
jgi:type II secretory pathway pseudopilin PulG